MKLHYIAYCISLTGLQDLNFAQHNTHVQILQLSNNNIFSVCSSISKTHSLKILDVSSNVISVLTQGCFNEHDNLVVVNISNDKLSIIRSHAFKSLNKMMFIDLSNNRISSIARDCFLNITDLYKLILINNFLIDMILNIFDTIQVSIIDTDDFHLCCIAPIETRCTASIPWYTSCSRLFPAGLMMICFSSDFMYSCNNQLYIFLS